MNKLEQIKNMDAADQHDFFAKFGIGAVIGFAISVWIIGTLVMLFPNGGTSVIGAALFNETGLKLTLLLWCGILYIVFQALTTVSRKNSVFQDDETGASFMKYGTHGTARWMTTKEIPQHFTVANIADTTDTVYGRLTKDGYTVVCYKPTYSKDGTELENTIVFGSPGTGKSFALVRTELMQSGRRKCSIVVTDPKGELFASLYLYYKNLGYDVKVLNLVKPKYSDYWDCMGEIIDPETDRISGTRLSEFANIYMQNVQDGKEDAFWANSAKTLLSACIGLAAYRRESFIIDQYHKLYEHLIEGDPKYLRTLKDMNPRKPNKDNGDTHDGLISIRKCEREILKVAAKKCYDLNEIMDTITLIREGAPKFNLKEVYDIIMDFQNLEGTREDPGEFEEMPDYYPAKANFRIYNTSETASVRTQALQGLQQKFQLFTDIDLLEMLSHPGIDLNTVNDRPTAIFVIMNDKADTLKAISSLFFSFFFRDAMQQFDDAEQLSKSTGQPNPKLPVTVMLDEFYSIGVIGGNPDTFTIVMSTARSRKLHVTIIVQGITQIAQRYGEENAKTIETDTLTYILLGCNDDATADFVSNFMCGKGTVRTESHKEMDGGGLFGSNSSSEMNAGTTARSLLTVDEVRMWSDRVLVAKRGALPLKLYPFSWKDHPCYRNGEIKECNLYEIIPPIGDREEDIDDFFSAASQMAGGNDFAVNFRKKLMSLTPKEEFKNSEFARFVDNSEVIEYDDNDVDDFFAPPDNDINCDDYDGVTAMDDDSDEDDSFFELDADEDCDDSFFEMTTKDADDVIDTEFTVSTVSQTSKENKTPVVNIDTTKKAGNKYSETKKHHTQKNGTGRSTRTNERVRKPKSNSDTVVDERVHETKTSDRSGRI